MQEPPPKPSRVWLAALVVFAVALALRLAHLWGAALLLRGNRPVFDPHRRCRSPLERGAGHSRRRAADGGRSSLEGPGLLLFSRRAGRDLRPFRRNPALGARRAGLGQLRPAGPAGPARFQSALERRGRTAGGDERTADRLRHRAVPADLARHAQSRRVVVVERREATSARLRRRRFAARPGLSDPPGLLVALGVARCMGVAPRGGEGRSRSPWASQPPSRP